MSVTSKLKKGVDLPMWEWVRPLPQATASSTPSTFATAGKPQGRYIYYLPSGAGFRYDIWTDGWTTITTPPFAQTTVASVRYNDYHGYSGRMISASSNGFSAAVPKGNKCVGKKVRIISGTGAGQIRTITEVSDPIVHDTMVATTASSVAMIDSNKTTYSLNQWRDYGLRIVTNTSSDFRKIIHNTAAGTVTFADNTFTSVGLPWSYSPLPFNTVVTDGIETRAQIESYNLTVDSAWDTTPDNTSVFIIQSGMMWSVNVAANRFALQSYDVLNDNWYQNTSVGGGLLNGNLSTDVALETLNESAVGILLNSTVASATNNSVTLDTSMSTNQYSNYIIKVISGAGIGQNRLITSSSGATININKKWDINPDATSAVQIVADNDKLYMSGAGAAALFEYDSVNDIWSDRRILEVGCPAVLSATWSGLKRPVPISTITRSGAVATATSVNASHGLKTGDIVTIAGATDALYNITATITVTAANAFTYVMAGTPSANAVAANAQSVTQLVDTSKSWTVDEHIGKIVTFTTTAFTATGGLTPTYYHRIITSNTATTLVFASGTAPTSGTTVYMITDARSHGGIFTSQLTGTPTATSLPVATTITDGVGVYAGLRAIVIDGANWGEASIGSNTATSITLTGTGLAFVPTTSAIVTVLGVTATSTGTSLEYLYNTSQKQRGKYMFGVRGGGTNYMYLYDITSNTWEVLNQMPNSETFTTGSMTAYDGDDRVYIQRDATGRVLYYDFVDNNLYSYNQIPFGMGNVTLGNKMSILKTEDGLKFIYIPRHTGSEFWRSLLWI